MDRYIYKESNLAIYNFIAHDLIALLYEPTIYNLEVYPLINIINILFPITEIRLKLIFINV